MAQHRTGQGIGNHRLHVLPALRTPVAMDGVFGHHRLNVFGDVLGIAGAGLPAALQLPLAMRTAGQTMLAPLIDPIGALPPDSGMTVLATRTLLSRRSGRLGVDRPHARRRARRHRERARGSRALPFRKQPGLLQQSEDDGLFATAKNLPRLRFGQTSTKTLEPHRLRRCAHDLIYRAFSFPKITAPCKMCCIRLKSYDKSHNAKIRGHTRRRRCYEGGLG